MDAGMMGMGGDGSGHPARRCRAAAPAPLDRRQAGDDATSRVGSRTLIGVLVLYAVVILVATYPYALSWTTKLPFWKCCPPT